MDIFENAFYFVRNSFGFIINLFIGITSLIDWSMNKGNTLIPLHVMVNGQVIKKTVHYLNHYAKLTYIFNFPCNKDMSNGNIKHIMEIVFGGCFRIFSRITFSLKSNKCMRKLVKN